MRRTDVAARAAADWPTDLIRFSTFAAEINVHVATLHRWRLNGLKRQPGRKFPAVRIGGCWFISRNAGREFIAGGQPDVNWLSAQKRGTERQQKARRARMDRRVGRYLDREGI